MNELEIKTTDIVSGALDIKITDQDSMAKAVNTLSVVNKQNDLVRKEKEKITKPLNKALSEERKRWKPIETRLKSAIDYLRKEIGNYQTRLDEEAEAKKDKIVSRIGEGRGKLTPETAVRQLSNVEGPDSQVEAAAGSVTFRNDYEITVTDIHLIPEEYLEVKESAIKSALKEGKEVPGTTHKLIKVPVNRR